MRPVFVLALAIGVIGANSLAIGPLAGAIARSFPGVAPAGVLFASSSYGATTALSAILLAPNIGRIGARRALLLAMGALSLSLGATAATPNLLVIVLLQGAAGLAAGVCLPTIYGFAADFAPPGRQNETVGKVLTGWTISLVFGVSLAALLADLLHWRAVFITLAVLGLVITLVLAKVIPAVARDIGSAAVPSPLDALRVPDIAPVLASVCAFMVAFYGLYAFVGPHVSEGLSGSTTMAGLVTLSYGSGYGAATLLDPIIDRLGRKRASPAVFGGLIATYAGLALTGHSYTALVLTAFLWGIGQHLGMTILVGRLTSISPRHRDALLGLYSGITYASVFLGTISFRLIYDHGGFAATALMAALAVVVVFALDRINAARWND